jgi:adenine-specific DNA methylase
VSDHRDKTGKPTQRQVLAGDEELALKLAAALSAEQLDDRVTHGFHAYPAGLHPDAARDLLACFPGDSLLDPFCGGGTILVEGRLAGRTTFGCDLSSVALRVSRARTATPTDEQLTAFRSAARRMTEKARTDQIDAPREVYEAVKDWYAPYAIRELATLREEIAEVEDLEVRRQLEAVFSSILIKVSWRRSDTSNQRVKHDRRPGSTAVLFHKKVRELARRQLALREAMLEDVPPTKLKLSDARQVRVQQPVDLVMTSPPYPAVYDYLPLQHLRGIWLGIARGEDPAREIGARRQWRGGARRARRQWTADTAAWMLASAQTLRPGGHLVVIVGDGLTPTGTVDTLGASMQAAKAADLEFVARASLLRPDHARQSVRWEHALAWRRPAS